MCISHRRNLRRKVFALTGSRGRLWWEWSLCLLRHSQRKEDQWSSWAIEDCLAPFLSFFGSSYWTSLPGPYFGRKGFERTLKIKKDAASEPVNSYDRYTPLLWTFRSLASFLSLGRNGLTHSTLTLLTIKKEHSHGLEIPLKDSFQTHLLQAFFQWL